MIEWPVTIQYRPVKITVTEAWGEVVTKKKRMNPKQFTMRPYEPTKRL
jgi:hypothetical protein